MYMYTNINKFVYTAFLMEKLRKSTCELLSELTICAQLLNL